MRTGNRRRQHEVQVAWTGRRPQGASTGARRAVHLVLARERVGPATIMVTALSTQRMRALNRRTFGRDRGTDVIAFGMQHDGRLIGDVYICPSLAVRSANALGIPPQRELLRLVIHGTLHVLGYDHPRGAKRRTQSRMWRRQERYLAAVLAGARR